MSDFFNSGWSVFVAVVTIVSVLACLVLLAIASRRKVMADDNTTGHVWDEDLVELNNPLPRWWMVLFVITVVFALGYLAVYPGLGSYAGKWGWSSVEQHRAEVDAAKAQAAPLYAKFAAADFDALAKDPQAMGIGERLFVQNCAACHGSDARGSKGYPNLTDRDWLHGSTPEAIKTSIANGRQGAMPSMAAAVGTPADVRNVAHYVLSLSGGPHDSLAAQLGKPKFSACAACHGGRGEGNPALGAPNLADDIWLHGWGEQAVVDIVTRGKTNTMPAHAARLTPEQVHVLGAYVASLSRSRLAP